MGEGGGGMAGGGRRRAGGIGGWLAGSWGYVAGDDHLLAGVGGRLDSSGGWLDTCWCGGRCRSSRYRGGRFTSLVDSPAGGVFFVIFLHDFSTFAIEIFQPLSLPGNRPLPADRPEKSADLEFPNQIRISSFFFRA